MSERHVSSRIPALILCDIIQSKCLTEPKAVTSEGKHKIQASMRTHSFGAKQRFSISLRFIVVITLTDTELSITLFLPGYSSPSCPLTTG
ncbi:hypothetical protein GDO81_007296 [Engystomops pustulosus]|uniref:Uncharacterized protein n=1 Tax=Engystomops pustulosus TaxID=76066 RepID=A0AAV7C7K9_ENGPU|nr:hypothetical protein GDO81_007296 [Engystomops pustulosus]